MFNGGAISLTCYCGMTITKHFRFYNFGAQLFLAAMLVAVLAANLHSGRFYDDSTRSVSKKLKVSV